MYHTEEYGPRFLVFLLDIVLDNIRKGAIASFVSLYDLPALFINDDNVVILVDYLHNLHIHATVDLNHLSAYIARHIRSQEGSHVGDILNLSPTAQRNLVAPLLANLLG